MCDMKKGQKLLHKKNLPTIGNTHLTKAGECAEVVEVD